MIAKLKAHLPFLTKWGKLVGLTGGAQVIIQGVGFLAGIYIIRILDTDQYGYYTLANTMLGTMTVLADGGISSGVMAQGGNQWQDRRELGRILATGMHLRRQFALFSLLVSIPILYYLLDKQGLEWWRSSLLILALVPAFLSALSGSLLQIIPRLHQDLKEYLTINTGINVGRLLMTLPLLFLFPFPAVAILISGVTQVGGNIQLRKLASKRADWRTEPDPMYREKILKTVRRVLPGSIYYCISGQITVWLLAIFSSTESVAQIGALSRLMMVLTLVKLVVDTLLVPRFARLPADRSLIVTRFFQVLGLLVGMGLVITGVVYLFPGPVLWILGEGYQNLEAELTVLTAGSCLTLVSSVAYLMVTSRAIIPNPYVFIAYNVVIQVLILIFLVDYTSLMGVIQFSVLSALLTLVYRIADFLYQVFFTSVIKPDEKTV